MQPKQIYKEILDEAKKRKINDLNRFNKLKLEVSSKYKCNRIPKNATIASMASDKDRNLMKKILSMKPVRTISGVAPIALMTDTYPCPHTIKGIGPCTYCPGGPGSVFGDVPQSYTGKEPSTRRAIRNHYDPYLGIFNRLEHYVAMGLVPEKTDVILQGGTFPFSPWIYREYFVKYLLKAMNDFSRLFYDEKGLDKEKFNLFFEMPANIRDNERTKRIHKKLLFIKNLNLGEKEILNSINNLFFNNGNDKNANEEKNNEKTLKNSEGIFGAPKISKKFSSDSIKNDYSNKTNNGLIDKWNNFDFNNGLISIETYNDISNSNKKSMNMARDKANNLGDKNISLETMQKQNETAKIRCIGLTIETKSDYGKLLHGNQMLRLGCTRVEIGIQSIYDKVLEKTNRGNTVQDNIDSIRILKDLGFKINAHYMPGLPLTTKEMDRKGLRELFENPDYRPDMLKIYPCMVMPGTRLYDDYRAGRFKPLMTKEAAELISWFKQFIPPYCRIQRIQRDIPTYATEAGVDRTNLRQYVEKLCKEKNIKCKCIRCREAGIKLRTKKVNLDNLKIDIIEYEASKGKEFFISAEDKENDVLFGYCRLRFPSQSLREEITKDSALIRELHVYSPAVEIGKTSDESFQHKGIGKALLKEAEKISIKNNKNKIVVISGIGAREYFKKFCYGLEGPYMVKNL